MSTPSLVTGAGGEVGEIGEFLPARITPGGPHVDQQQGARVAVTEAVLPVPGHSAASRRAIGARAAAGWAVGKGRRLGTCSGQFTA